jgi:hypothetical protein
MVGGQNRRLLYVAEAIVIAVGALPLFMLFYPVALLVAPAAFLAGYGAIRPAWMWEGRKERRQYVHLAAVVAVAGIVFFVLSVSGVLTSISGRLTSRCSRRTPLASARPWSHAATPRAALAAPRGRGTLEGGLGVRC